MMALVAHATDGLERAHSELLVAAAAAEGSEGGSHGGTTQRTSSETLKRVAADLKTLRARIATGGATTGGTGTGTAPHFEGLLATEVSHDEEDEGNNATGGGGRFAAASAAAIADENKALRRSVAAQNDRIEVGGLSI